MPRATQFLELAHSLAERLDDPYARGMVHLAGGMIDFCVGRWPGRRGGHEPEGANAGACRDLW